MKERKTKRKISHFFMCLRPQPIRFARVQLLLFSFFLRFLVSFPFTFLYFFSLFFCFSRFLSKKEEARKKGKWKEKEENYKRTLLSEKKTRH